MSLLTNGVIALLDQPDFDTRLAILQVVNDCLFIFGFED